MSKSMFKNEASYRAYKKREYDRYYRATQIYPRRIWTQDEISYVISVSGKISARTMSGELHRSIKSIEHMKAKLRGEGLIE